MPYTKTTWVDEVLSGDENYEIIKAGGGAIANVAELADVEINLTTLVGTAGTPVTASAMNNIEDEIERLSENIRDAATELTLASDAVTITQSNHKLQPETSTTDNLSTINGTTAGQSGVLYCTDFGTDTITIKHNVGNILCLGGNDITLSNGCVFWYSNGTKVFISSISPFSISGLTEDTAPDLKADFVPTYDTSASGNKKSRPVNLHSLIQGMATEYKLNRSVASNNLTLSMTTPDGTALSSSNPVKARIGNTDVFLTGAQVITANAGTNYMNLGSAELAATVQELFLYLVNETGGAAGVKLLASRIPYAKTMNDFSATNTNEKGYIWNGTTRTVTDEVELIGKVNVTLGVSASYNWSVPGTSLIISRPIYETSWLTWTPVFTGFSADPTVGTATYKIVYDRIEICVITSGGTSNATTFTMTAPFVPAVGMSFAMGRATDGGTVQTAACKAAFSAANNTITLRANMATGAWTNTGGKSCDFRASLPIA